MKRKEKAEKIVKILESFYPETPIPLNHNSVFQLLIAVLMSAQTTDKKVNQVTPNLFEIAPNAELMSQLEAEKIQSIIREVGLAPTKAKNIKKLSEMLVELHHGNVPNNFEDLEALPGVGHKTASVVMAQAFNVPALTSLVRDPTIVNTFNPSPAGGNVKCVSSETVTSFGICVQPP